MATIKIKLKKQKTNKRGHCPICFSLSHNNRRVYIPLHLTAPPQLWENDHINSFEPDYISTNMKLKLFYNKAKLFIDDLSLSGVLFRMPAVELKNLIYDHIFPAPGQKVCNRSNFAATLRRFANIKNPTTKQMYLYTLKRMADLDPLIETRSFNDINIEYLTDFNNGLKNTSQNYRNIHLRNIRSVFNFAIDEELTNFYPFRRFKIKPVRTAKRSLTVEELRTLFNYPVEDYAVQYRDMFILMFLLCGINGIDLYNLSEIYRGRIEFNRRKTGRFYSIKVEPEAMEIIERYRGQNALLNIADSYRNHADYFHRMNLALKRIGTLKIVPRTGRKIITPLFPKISAYWARHTWATIAAEIDIPDPVITLGLGHGPENTTTEIYIRRNQAKVDVANRRIIDYVMHGIDYREKKSAENLPTPDALK